MRSSKVRCRRPPDRRVCRQPCSRYDPLMHAVGRAGRAQAFPLVAKQWTNVQWDQSGHDQIPGTGEESSGMTWVGEITIVQQMNNPISTHHHYQDVLNVMKPTTCLTLVVTNIRSHALNVVVVAGDLTWHLFDVTPILTLCEGTAEYILLTKGQWCRT